MYKRKGLYYETDQMGVIHHSNYIKWFEEARLEFLDKHDIPYDKLEKNGVIIPVLSVECNYKEFIRYNQEVHINLKIIEFNGVRMKIMYKIYDAITNRLTTTGTTTHCFLNSNYQVINLKKEYLEIYNKFNSLIDNK